MRSLAAALMTMKSHFRSNSMGIFDLVTNTVEGLAQTTIGAGKAAVGTVTAVVDSGHTLGSGLENMRDGIDKIGKSDKPKEQRNDEA